MIIPKANAGDLMLRHDVVESCRSGQFAVYAVKTIHEALELFTGMSAAPRDTEGNYPEGSLLALAFERSFEYWLKAHRSADAMMMEEMADEESAESPTPPTPTKPPTQA